MTGERPQDDDVVEPTEDAPAGDADDVAPDGEIPDAESEPELEADAEEAAAAGELEDEEDRGLEPRPVLAPPRKGSVAAAAVAAERAHDDELPYVDDRISKWWVGLIALVFIGILVWGLLGGKGGLLNPQPTAEPTPSPAPSLTATPAASSTPRPTTTAAPATSPSAAPSGTPLPSATPVGAPTVAPSPT